MLLCRRYRLRRIWRRLSRYGGGDGDGGGELLLFCLKLVGCVWNESGGGGYYCWCHLVLNWNWRQQTPFPRNKVVLFVTRNSFWILQEYVVIVGGDVMLGCLLWIVVGILCVVLRDNWRNINGWWEEWNNIVRRRTLIPN